MAAQHLAATRRTAIASFAAAGLAGAIPGAAQALASPVGKAAWESAFSHMQRVHRAWRQADERAGILNTDVTADELEALTEAFSDAEQALLDMPAPDRKALCWKLDRLLEGGIKGPWTESYSADTIRQTVLDYRRLLGDA